MAPSAEDNNIGSEKTLDNIETEQRDAENESNKSARTNTDATTNNNSPVEGKIEISFEAFQSFLKCYFSDLSQESFQKIVSPPILNIDEINTNLFDLKCENLTETDVNIDELLITAIMSDEDEDFELEKCNISSLKDDETSNTYSEKNEETEREMDEPFDQTEKNLEDSDITVEKDEDDEELIFELEDSQEKDTDSQNTPVPDTEIQTTYENDIIINRNIGEEKIPLSFFKEYKRFIEKIELKNLNTEGNPLIDLLKKQIDVNNTRRERLKEELQKKIKYIAVFKTLREIDKRIEKLLFKKLKQKRKKKGEEESEFISKMIEERKIFKEAFKEDLDVAYDMLKLTGDLFNDENVDVSFLGLETLNMFP